MSTRVREVRKEAARADYAPRLKQLYEGDLRAQLKDELGLSSSMEVPRIQKITLNMGVGEAKKGMPIGARVTLRGTRMYEFLDRLIAIALPRIRDFRGLNPGSFDGRGNYSLGIREQIIFPEIDYDDIQQVRGLDVAITTSAKTDEHGLALLRGLGMPFAADGREQ
ncbi:MAG: 50S ribosomal protein L5 [Actinobacteria bacterium]|nr:MAG: 50S ribosomal protein L5 [Actinomycetota bacterium]